MNKLKLDVDALRIESFHPDDASATAGGTVHGADSSAGDGCPASYPFHCLPQPSRGCGE